MTNSLVLPSLNFCHELCALCVPSISIEITPIMPGCIPPSSPIPTSNNIPHAKSRIQSLLFPVKKLYTPNWNCLVYPCISLLITGKHCFRLFFFPLHKLLLVVLAIQRFEVAAVLIMDSWKTGKSKTIDESYCAYWERRQKNSEGATLSNDSRARVPS